MTDRETGVVTALGALLGYVGSQAATTALFEQLLWPQRHLANPSWRSAVMAALLMPMSGPLHKAASEVFDTLYRDDIFRDAYRGHMLGTAFFKNTGWTYSMYDAGVKGPPKAVGNCIWVRAMTMLSIPHLRDGSACISTQPKEQKEASRQTSVRAQIPCYHLTFNQATQEDKASHLPFVHEGVDIARPQVYLSLIAAESSAIVIAVVLIATWKTPWAILWLAPFLLRLISTFFAIHREPLQYSQLTPQDYPCDFEIHCPESNGDFIVLTGPPPTIEQFMSHYGHPHRNFSKEILQLTVIFALGWVFPVGIVSSALFMPLHLKYIWFGYQIFLVAGLHFARYWQFSRHLSIDAAITEAFSKGDRFISAGESSLLFGHKRSDSRTLRIDLKMSSYRRYVGGKMAIQDLLQGSIKDTE